MNTNTSANVKKLSQVTEEALTPIQVPIIFGNEYYIITQQDMRKIEDTRLLSYSKLTPNGEMIPMELLGHDNNVREAILNAGNCRADINTLTEALAKLYATGGAGVEQMQFQTTPTVATMEQQLRWSRANKNSSAPFPFCSTAATSTSELTPSTRTQRNKNEKCNCGCCCCRCKQTSTGTVQTRGCNTTDINEASGRSAREQLKQKKMSQDLSYVA